MKDVINKKIRIAEKRILELTKSGDLKKISEREKYHISKFYLDKSRNRLETARIIYNASKKEDKLYNDYAEVVSCCYYSMYYVVHGFLASEYRTKLKEGLRGVHAITEHIILYYLVKTGKLAKHLYDEYLKTFRTVSEVQKLGIEDFQKGAYEYAKKYDKARSAREIFTYNTSPSIEEYHAKQILDISGEFTNKIRQIIIS